MFARTFARVGRLRFDSPLSEGAELYCSWVWNARGFVDLLVKFLAASPAVANSLLVPWRLIERSPFRIAATVNGHGARIERGHVPYPGLFTTGALRSGLMVSMPPAVRFSAPLADLLGESEVRRGERSSLPRFKACDFQLTGCRSSRDRFFAMRPCSDYPAAAPSEIAMRRHAS